MNRVKKITALFLCCTLLVSCGITALSADSVGEFCMEAENMEANYLNNIEIGLYLSLDTPGYIDGFQADIAFDNAKLLYIGFNAEPAFSSITMRDAAKANTASMVRLAYANAISAIEFSTARVKVGTFVFSVIATEDESTTLTFSSENSATSVILDGESRYSPLRINSIGFLLNTDGFADKTRTTFYTEERLAAARENTSEYSWAESMKNGAVENAAKYVGLEEKLWSMVPGEGIPRGAAVGLMNDPESYTCRYCGNDLRANYGTYPWISRPLIEQWKITCPNCERKFPSNDFEAYYNSGLNEHGIFDKTLADGTLLTNDLYPEKGVGWGVDDGWGYRPGTTAANGVVNAHTYIAYYNHYGLWYNSSRGNNARTLFDALDTLKRAYLYTGEAKYGRVGAILLDRIADVYPDYDLWAYGGALSGNERFWNSHGMSYEGKILGRIWETTLALAFAESYDVFFPMYDDAEVVAFLSDKANICNLENKKQTPSQIRKNCEDGLLREIYAGCRSADIYGNFGMHQSALAMSAIVLDTQPETSEWINYIMQDGGKSGRSVTGGNVSKQLVDVVNRDGAGNEAGPGYNQIWVNDTQLLADIFRIYDGDTTDLYENPKFVKMLSQLMGITLIGRTTPSIGDSGSTGAYGLGISYNNTLNAFSHIKTPILAQMLYKLNGNSSAGIHYDLFTRNPDSAAADVARLVAEYGEYDFNVSSMQPSYGFAALRDTNRDFWMYFGRGLGHGHPDALNLGIEAYGIDMAPDLGYPEATGSDPNRIQWICNTISHNTVVVNEKKQSGLVTNATPLHFDDGGQAKVMDVDASAAYAETDIYRRTVVMVRVSDEVSYGVDFFRVRGGNNHVYSFHSQSDEITMTDNLQLVPQQDELGNYVGTYAGVDVAWGANSNYLNGYSWLRNVRKALNPGSGSFTVDFKIKDFRNALSVMPDLHLRMTQVNPFELSEVSIVEGTPPRTVNNPAMLEYVLACRRGSDLDSLFTTVFQPYKDAPYLADICAVSTDTPGARALKITHVNGRVDYIVYSPSYDTQITVDDKFEHTGFIGVYTFENGIVTYSYKLDSERVSGTVADFTREFTTSNSITVSGVGATALSELSGKYINIENDGYENAVYEIESASSSGDNTELDIGDVTTVRAQGYVYNIAENQSFNIPLSESAENTAKVVRVSQSDSAAISAEFKSMLSESREMLFVCAVYQDGKMYSADTASATLAPLESYTFIPTIQRRPAGESIVKTFVLDAETLSPLA